MEADMEIFQVAVVGIIAVILALVLKPFHGEFAIYITIAAGVVILFFVAGYLEDVVGVVQSLAEKTGLSSQTLGILFKIVGIGYITEFASQICKVAGQGAIGMKIELAGKILIIAVSLPIFTALLDTLSSILL